ncbi:MAG: ABC transporter ATP-binding protein [Pseudomonadota bacterium]
MLLVEDLSTPQLQIPSLSISAGECVVVVGPSGAGKSLLLRSIADLDPNEGNISLDGRARATMSAWRWRRQVMFVPAESGWWSDRVSDHFLTDDVARHLITSLGLPTEAISWNITRLSTGERHRLAIARALGHQPKALLLDEPSAALDAEATKRLEVVLQERLAAGMSLLLVTHDQDQAERLGSRTITLDRGRIVECDE